MKLYIVMQQKKNCKLGTETGIHIQRIFKILFDDKLVWIQMDDDWREERREIVP